MIDIRQTQNYILNKIAAPIIQLTRDEMFTDVLIITEL